VKDMENMGTVLFLANYPYGERSKKCRDSIPG